METQPDCSPVPAAARPRNDPRVHHSPVTSRKCLLAHKLRENSAGQGEGSVLVEAADPSGFKFRRDWGALGCIYFTKTSRRVRVSRQAQRCGKQLGFGVGEDFLEELRGASRRGAFQTRGPE
jgi:hypothetical protein